MTSAGGGRSRRPAGYLLAAWLGLLGLLLALALWLLLAPPPPHLVYQPLYTAELPAAEPEAAPDAADDPAQDPAAESATPVPPSADRLTPDPATAPADAGDTAASETTGPEAASPAPDEPLLAAPQPAPPIPATPEEAAADPAGQPTTREDSAADASDQAAALAPEATWQRHASRIDLPTGQARVAVIVTGLGLAEGVTELALQRLPPEVTLSFSPYAPRLDAWMARARAAGHEVMLDLPMEPLSYPEDDPGPRGLLTGLGPEENLKRLHWVLDRGSDYIGLAAVMGSRFTATPDAVRPILEELAAQGLIFVDNREAAQSAAAAVAHDTGLAYLANDRSLDTSGASRLAIDAWLAQVERLARNDSGALAMTRALPIAIDRLEGWALSLRQRDVALVPVSALLQQRQRLAEVPS